MTVRRDGPTGRDAFARSVPGPSGATVAGGTGVFGRPETGSSARRVIRSLSCDLRLCSGAATAEFVGCRKSHVTIQNRVRSGWASLRRHSRVAHSFARGTEVGGSWGCSPRIGSWGGRVPLGRGVTRTVESSGRGCRTETAHVGPTVNPEVGTKCAVPTIDSLTVGPTDLDVEADGDVRPPTVAGGLQRP